MRTTKDGTPPIGRSVWTAMADVYRGSARDLAWLITNSLDALDGKPGAVESVCMEALPVERSEIQRCRMNAEIRAYLAREAAGDEEWTPEATEVQLLLSTLLKYAKRQREHAEACESLAKACRRGAPTKRKIVTNNVLAALGGGFVYKPRPSKRGRPKAADIPDAMLLAASDTARQQGRAQKDALREIAAEWLRVNGRHTAGERLEALTENFGRRVRAARKLV